MNLVDTLEQCVIVIQDNSVAFVNHFANRILSHLADVPDFNLLKDNTKTPLMFRFDKDFDKMKPITLNHLISMSTQDLAEAVFVFNPDPQASNKKLKRVIKSFGASLGMEYSLPKFKFFTVRKLSEGT